MDLKNKIAAAALCAIFTGIGIFGLGTDNTNVASALSLATTPPSTTLTIDQLQAIILDLQRQIAQIIQLIEQRKQTPVTPACAKEGEQQTSSKKCCSGLIINDVPVNCPYGAQCSVLAPTCQKPVTPITKTCYGEGEGVLGLQASGANPISCCSGLTAASRSSCSGNMCSVTEGFICKKTEKSACKNEGELFGYLEADCCAGLLKVYPDGAKTYQSGDSQNFQVTCKKPETFVTSAPGSCIIANIKAGINGKYVTAENVGAGALIANRDKALTWESFYIIPVSGGINIKATINNKYVTAENVGASPLIANRDAAGPWELFTIVTATANTNNIALKASVNNRFVTAENGGAQSLIANRDAIGPWETFTIIKTGDCPTPITPLVDRVSNVF